MKSSRQEPSQDSDFSRLKKSLEQSLLFFGLTGPLTLDRLEKRYCELLTTWHPHRYANLTNNPRKYMQMYQKGEAMTKDVHAAYHVLKAWLLEREGIQRDTQKQD